MNPNYLDFEQPIAELEVKIEELQLVGSDAELNLSKELGELRAKSARLTEKIFANLTPWEVVKVARHPLRPYSLDYIPRIFSEFDELHGDRHFGDDKAIVGGIARLDGRAVMVIGQEKGRAVKDKVYRNFGMPKPEGYRKALRLMELAERFSLPVITLIDTPGAYPGIDSEERGISESIATNLAVMSRLRTPIISVVIGEGSSGGALGIGVGDHLAMLQYSTYFVISPRAAPTSSGSPRSTRRMPRRRWASHPRSCRNSASSMRRSRNRSGAPTATRRSWLSAFASTWWRSWRGCAPGPWTNCWSAATSGCWPTATESRSPGAAPPVAAALARALDAAVGELAAAPRVLLGYSGGLDSSVMLDCLAPRLGGRLVAVHVDHGLHGDAARWREHCSQRCAALGVAFVARRVEVRACGRGLEAAAREARYGCFEALLEPGEVLLLAHHLDDQAETLLLRLLRGAGPDGLAAMPRCRPLGAGLLLRPLLDVPRSDLLREARHRGLDWVEDPGNTGVDFDRSYLRNEVLPRLAARWPAYARTFGRAASLMRDLTDALPGEALAERCSLVGDPGFSTACLPDEASASMRAVRRWLREHGLAAPPAARLAAFCSQLAAGQGAEMALDGWLLRRYRDAVYLHPPLPTPGLAPHPVRAGDTVALDGIGHVTLLAAGGVPGGAALTLRPRRGGERLRRADGTHLDLKTLFQTLGVPPFWRPRVPLLFAGDELLAVGPWRRAAVADAAGIALRWEPPTALPH
jgi:acetyl-CoA carboxylase carboxyl transferase subunit alpha